MALHLQNCGAAENFVGLDPWEPISCNSQGHAAGQVATCKGSGLKEKVLKMVSLDFLSGSNR